MKIKPIQPSLDLGVTKPSPFAKYWVMVSETLPNQNPRKPTTIALVPIYHRKRAQQFTQPNKQRQGRSSN